MRVLLVNGNTSGEVTETLAEVARGAAGPGTEIVQATGAFGAALIGHRAAAAIAQHAVLEAIAENVENVDGKLKCNLTDGKENVRAVITSQVRFRGGTFES